MGVGRYVKEVHPFWNNFLKISESSNIDIMKQLLAPIFKYRFFLFLAVSVILQYYDYSETAFIIFMIAIVDLANNYQENKKKQED